MAARTGVRAAGIVNNLPVSGDAWTSWLTIENAARPTGVPPEVGYRTASAGYFSALEIPVLEGRGISDGDTATSLKTAVVNAALDARFFSSRRAIGSRVRLGPKPKGPWRTIVGVVGNVHHGGPEAPVAPEVFLPASQDVNEDMELALRTDGDASAMASTVREIVHEVDPTVTVWQFRTMDGILDEHLAPRRQPGLIGEEDQRQRRLARQRRQAVAQQRTPPPARLRRRAKRPTPQDSRP